MQDTSASSGNRRIAMLVDGENAQLSLIDKMLVEVSKYGLVTIRRVYGDWTTDHMKASKEIMSANAVQPMQQFCNTRGKNAIDIALIIDAMDILYEGTVNGFCLVSSDSDYTRLATRIREKGLFVMGIGRNDTPRSLVNACEVFVYTENLQAEKRVRGIARSVEETSDVEVAPDPVPLLRRAVDMAVQEDGRAFLGTVGGYLRQLDPSFDLRTYGYKQLSQLFRAHAEAFAVEEKKSRSGPSQIYIQLRDENAR